MAKPPWNDSRGTDLLKIEMLNMRLMVGAVGAARKTSKAEWGGVNGKSFFAVCNVMAAQCALLDLALRNELSGHCL